MIRPVPEAVAAELRPAAVVFAEHGVERARIEDITSATGVGASKIYYYFEGKEDLAAFLLGDWLEEMASAVESALDEPGTAPRRLSSVIRAQVKLMVSNPDPSRLLLSGSGRLPQLPAVSEKVHASFHRPVEKLVAAGIDEGAFRPIDAETASAAIFGAVTVGTLHFLESGDQLDAAVLADTISEITMRGLVVS